MDPLLGVKKRRDIDILATYQYLPRRYCNWGKKLNRNVNWTNGKQALLLYRCVRISYTLFRRTGTKFCPRFIDASDWVRSGSPRRVGPRPWGTYLWFDEWENLHSWQRRAHVPGRYFTWLMQSRWTLARESINDDYLRYTPGWPSFLKISVEVISAGTWKIQWE